MNLYVKLLLYLVVGAILNIGVFFLCIFSPPLRHVRTTDEMHGLELLATYAPDADGAVHWEWDGHSKLNAIGYSNETVIALDVTDLQAIESFISRNAEPMTYSVFTEDSDRKEAHRRRPPRLLIERERVGFPFAIFELVGVYVRSCSRSYDGIAPEVASVTNIGSIEQAWSWGFGDLLWTRLFLNSMIWAFVVWSIVRAFRWVKQGRRLRRGLCPRCKYPIGVSPVCTECGTQLPHARIKTQQT